MKKGFVAVEGHGEVEAVKSLLSRIPDSVERRLVWTGVGRYKKLHMRAGVEQAARVARAKQGTAAFLVLRDADEACPREIGPETATWLAEMRLPFPSAVVLFKPEYEVLFLPCVEQLAGRRLREGKIDRPGLKPNAQWRGPGWEARRGVKEWLTSQFEDGRSYKPTTDQLAFTRMLNIETIRRANVPCFGTLERALVFLESAGAGEVYPLTTR